MAITVGDLHLSHTPPRARSNERDWYGVMARYLHQLRDLQAAYNCPILCAGDIFDHWDAPPELITFAIKHLPYMYAIPGQHDLRHHNYEEIHVSAYWTLVEAKVIHDLEPGRDHFIGEHLCVVAYPWGYNLGPHGDRNKERLDIALVHRYCWRRGHSYTGAPTDHSVAAHRKDLCDFDIAVFGDNHRGFVDARLRPYIINGGGFIRRKADEVDYTPQLGMIYENNTIGWCKLDISRDAPLVAAAETEPDLGVGEWQEFIDAMHNRRLEDDHITFREALVRFMRANPTGPRVRALIMEALEHGR